MANGQTEKLETLIEHSEEITGTSVWRYLTFSLLLPPVSVILALLWAIRRGVIFVVLPSVTILFSVISLILPIVIYFLFGSVRMVTTQFSFSSSIYKDSKLTIFSSLLILTAIAGLVLGIYLRRQAKHVLSIEAWAVAVLVIILIVEHLLLWLNFSIAGSFAAKQTQFILQQQGVPF